ncbi:MAG TPA: PEGA domain-containing protein, partial [Myxococcaceae bacterium]|nr:PEGA domain-containing protein [Myxococcaceae bacterium]
AVRPESQSEPPVLTPGRKPTLGGMPAQGRAAPPPYLEEPEEPEEEHELPARATPSERTPVPASSNRMPLIAGAAVLLVLLLGLGAFFALKPPPSGFLLLNLPGDVQARARVNINGQDLKMPPSGPLLHQMPAGPALVLVSVEGHAPFTRSVEVLSGTTPTPLEVKLERTVQLTRLVITTRPADAELRLGGKVVREQGSSEPYIGEVEVGSKVEVEVRAKGYKPYRKNLEIDSEKPVALSADLEREGFEVQVSSYPSGALVFADGKELGETPLKVRLAASVKEVSLKKRCYEDAELEVAPSEDGSPTTVKHRLKKIRGCR